MIPIPEKADAVFAKWEAHPDFIKWDWEVPDFNPLLVIADILDEESHPIGGAGLRAIVACRRFPRSRFCYSSDGSGTWFSDKLGAQVEDWSDLPHQWFRRLSVKNVIHDCRKEFGSVREAILDAARAFGKLSGRMQRRLLVGNPPAFRGVTRTGL